MWNMNRSDDEPLGFLLYRVMAALRPQVAAELKPLGLGLPEFVCMRILAQHPGLTSAELTRGTHVSAQAMNQVLHALEDRGAPDSSGVNAGGPSNAGPAHPPR